MATPRNFTTPCGRLVQGSLSKAYEKKDDKGALVLGTKPGAGFGLPINYYYFALAIPKTPGCAHWANEPWAAPLWAAGHEQSPSAGQIPTFAWKVQDGDSVIPNTKNKRPCDSEGFPGNWVLSFKSGYAPKLWSLVGQPPGQPVAVTTPDFINLGDYAQVNANVAPNGNQTKPGIYVNPSMVCLIGYGQRITVGPDVAAAGFGGAMPAGASATPPGGFAPPAALGAPAVPNAPPPPGAPILGPASAPAYPPAPAGPSPVYAAPAAAPAHVMTPAGIASGFTYEQYMATPGYTDALLVQQGLMYPPMPAIAAVPPAPQPVGSAPPPPPGAPIAVVPNPGFVQVPPPPAPPPPAAAGPVMAAGAPTYASLQAAGWSDAQMRQAGYLM